MDHHPKEIKNVVLFQESLKDCLAQTEKNDYFKEQHFRNNLNYIDFASPEIDNMLNAKE